MGMIMTKIIEGPFKGLLKDMKIYGQKSPHSYKEAI